MSWKAAALVAAALVVGIGLSRLAEGNAGTATWDAARAAGFAAYLLLWASAVTGVAVHMRWRPGGTALVVIIELHRITSTLALAFVVGHVFGLLIDPIKPFFTIANALLPFGAAYRPLQVGLGVISAWFLIVVLLSTAFAGWMRWSIWKNLHYLSFPCYVLALLHGLTTGTDSRTGVAVLIYVVTASLFGAVLAARLFGRGWVSAAEPHAHP